MKIIPERVTVIPDAQRNELTVIMEGIPPDAQRRGSARAELCAGARGQAAARRAFAAAFCDGGPGVVVSQARHGRFHSGNADREIQRNRGRHHALLVRLNSNAAPQGGVDASVSVAGLPRQKE